MDKGQRTRALASLDAVINALGQYSAVERHAWVLAYCEARLDERQRLPGHCALVVRALMPEMRRDIDARPP